MRAALPWIVISLAVVVTLSVLAAWLLPGYVWHPLDAKHHNGAGYNIWSGILGSFLTSVPGWLVALYLYLKNQNCHADGCWRLAWHTHGTHGHPVCRHHHPHGGNAPHTIGGTPHTDLA